MVFTMSHSKAKIRVHGAYFMDINYIIPRSTNHANAELVRIFKIAKSTNLTTSIRDQALNTKFINITYGYLGFYCQAFFGGIIKNQADIFNNNYIIDHSFSPTSLKGTIFRLSRMNSELETMIFPQAMISGQEKDIIYENLTQISEANHLSTTMEIKQADEIRMSQKQVVILIKNSSLQERIKKSGQPLVNQWKHFKYNENEYIHAISFKPWEIKLTKLGHHRVIEHRGKKVKISANIIKRVYCPTSMMAIELIAKGLPIKLSKGHPLYGLLGEYVPKLKPKERIEMLMSCITKISFSLNKLQKVHDLLIESRD